MIRLILDSICLRVIYFTRDINEPISVVDGTLLYDYSEELPEKFGLNNCWSWKLRGNKLVFDDNVEVVDKPTLLEKNKKAVILLLKDRIKKVRSMLFNNIHEGSYLHQLTLFELQKDQSDFIKMLAIAKNCSIEEIKQEILNKQTHVETVLKNTELNLHYYVRLIDQIETSFELFKIRDEIANEDLTKINF